MPPLPSPGAFIRVELQVTDSASIVAGSRWYMAYTGGPPNSTDLNTLAAAVKAAYTTSLGGWLHDQESLTAVNIRDLSSDVGAVGAWAGIQTGTLDGTAIPSSACVLLDHHVARSYRGGHPRTFMRLGDTSVMDGTNEWTATFSADVLTGWTAFQATIRSTTGLSIVVGQHNNISWYQGIIKPPPVNPVTGRARNIPTLRPGGPVTDPIVTTSVPVKIASQRRRLNL